MRVLNSVLHNIGPFKHFEFNLEHSEGTLVALVAPNGSGKTTALEMAWLGTCFRDTETQDSIVDRATARDAYLESTIESDNGECFVVRHAVDPVSRTGESVVSRNGRPVYKGTKVSVFDAWSRKNLPSRDILTATVFAAQDSNRFLKLTSAERISIILKAVGVAEIEKMAALARKEETRVKDEVRVLSTRIADATSTYHYPADAADDLERLRAALSQAELRLSEKQGALDLARELAGSSSLARRRYEELMDRLLVLRNEVSRKREALEVAVERLEICDVEIARNDADRTREHAASTAQQLATMQSRAMELRVLREEMKRRTASRGRVSSELERAKERLSKTTQLVTNNQWVIDHSDELRDALTKAEGLRKEIQLLEVEQTRLRGEIERYELSARQHDADRKRHQESAAEADGRIARATETLKNRVAIDEASAKLESEREAAGEAEARVTVARSRLSELRDTTIAGAANRIENLRGAHIRIRDVATSEESWGISNSAIADDDHIVELAEEHPRLVAEAQAAIALHEEGLRQHLNRLRSVESLAAQAPVILAAAEELTAATSERTRSQTAATEADSMAQEAHRLATEAAITLKAATHKLEANKAELAGLEPFLKRAAALATAEERLAELRPQLEQDKGEVVTLAAEFAALPQAEIVDSDPNLEFFKREADHAAEQARIAGEQLVGTEATRMQLEPMVETLRAELVTLETQLGATPEPVPPEAAPNVAMLEAELEAAKARGSSAAREVGTAEQRLEQAKSAQKRVEELNAEQRALELELSDWTRLVLDLGRDGIQSAEVDSAGPELTALTNDLLLTCHGPRYSVRISTTRTKADGKGEIDECRVMVSDAADNSEREGSKHSGGEKVIVNEAISLALSMMACRRARVSRSILVRDETGGALDTINTRAYIAMLRRAAQFTHADKVVFVSQSKQAQELADSIIELTPGESRSVGAAA